MTRIRESPNIADFIVDSVVQRGEIRSLFRFCVENGLSYPYANFLVRRLSARGFLRVERLTCHGRPLLIQKGPMPYVP